MMAKATGFALEQQIGAALSCGRSIDEQLELMRKYGSHGVAPIMRALSLAAHGSPKPKEKASNDSGCSAFLGEAAKERLQMINFPEIILQALRG
jgi:hypothetical protein